MVTSGTDDKSRTSESNLAGEGRERVRENWEFRLRYVSEHLQASSFLSPSLSLSHLFYLELYMPQFRICVKQCAKLYTYIYIYIRIAAKWTVSRNDKPDKNSNLWIFKVSLNLVNFSRNIGKWFIGLPLYFTDSSNYEHQTLIKLGETIFQRFI